VASGIVSCTTFDALTLAMDAPGDVKGYKRFCKGSLLSNIAKTAGDARPRAVCLLGGARDAGRLAAHLRMLRLLAHYDDSPQTSATVAPIAYPNRSVNASTGEVTAYE
jgi:hypothetical protein